MSSMMRLASAVVSCSASSRASCARLRQYVMPCSTPCITVSLECRDLMRNTPFGRIPSRPMIIYSSHLETANCSPAFNVMAHKSGGAEVFEFQNRLGTSTNYCGMCHEFVIDRTDGADDERDAPMHARVAPLQMLSPRCGISHRIGASHCMQQ